MWADVLKLDTHIVQHLFFEHILFAVSNPRMKNNRHGLDFNY